MEPDRILFSIWDPAGTRSGCFCQIKIRLDPDLGKQWPDNAGSGVWIRYITFWLKSYRTSIKQHHRNSEKHTSLHLKSKILGLQLSVSATNAFCCAINIRVITKCATWKSNKRISILTLTTISSHIPVTRFQLSFKDFFGVNLKLGVI